MDPVRHNPSHYITLTNYAVVAPRRQQSKAQPQSIWVVEGVEQSSMTAEKLAFEQQFSSHTNQQPDGRFVIRFPKKIDPTRLGSTRFSEEQRLHATGRRLEHYPDLNVQYHKFMDIYK